MHSTASDGALPPSQVVAAAKAAGLAAIALTDHDTMDGVPEALATGEALGIRIIRGAELSAFDGAREIHLLALHVGKPDVLERRLEYFRDARQSRARRIVERLNRIGLKADVDSVLAEANGGAVGRPHIARVLVQTGAVRDTREAFDRFLGNGRPGFVPKERLDVKEAIALAHSAGAIAVWAHPGGDGRRARLEPLVESGLDGVEVRHPSHLAEDVARLGALADFLGILKSGGSDWHGSPDGARTIGCMHIPMAWLERQDEVVATRLSAEVA